MSVSRRTALRAFGLLLLVVYALQIGLWRFALTAFLVGAFVAAVFGSQYLRVCADAWVEFRRGAVWSPLGYQTMLLILLHALLVQAQLNELLPSHSRINLGPALQALEAPFHLSLPNPMPFALAWFWLGIYLFVFPALLLGLLIVLNGYDEGKSLRIYLRACNLVLWLALPLFALLCVPEVWIQLDGYEPPAVSPGRELAFYRFLSGPSNCLPSLHCTLALLATAVGWQSGIPTLRRLVTTLGLLVCLSTVIIGVHWITDVIFSIPLAALALGAARLLESSRERAVQS
jgi:membrane-associated phospholipid phosphatase